MAISSQDRLRSLCAQWLLTPSFWSSHMADLRGFNANTVEPMDSFDPIPAWEYLCVITASE